MEKKIGEGHFSNDMLGIRGDHFGVFTPRDSQILAIERGGASAQG